MRIRTILSVSAATASVIALTACPGFDQTDCLDLNTCDCTFDDAGVCHREDGGSETDGMVPPGTDGSMDASPDGARDGSPGSEAGADTGPSCDLAMDPKDAPACVDDADGVFVDATNGNDSGDGTKAHPFASITKAIAVGSQSRVYICSGTYTDPLTISSQHAVSLYGGFACGTWTYTGTKATIAPGSGTAVTLSGASGVQLEDLQIDASADTVAGSSAIGVFLNGGAATLSRVAVTVGGAVTGAHGVDGSTSPNYTGTSAKNGIGPTGSTNGPEVDCTCTDKTTSTGGKGASTTDGFPGAGLANPAAGSPNSGMSGTNSCTGGTGGAGGAPGTPGNGSTTGGTLSASGWINSQIGSAGGNGSPAQGGGGGGAESSLGFAGGSGACGGCGGTGGTAGGNGGSSYAVLVFSGSLSIVGCALTAGNAGAGGTGGAGEDAQSGGAASAGACTGAGAGSGGGAGGTGGAGAGGGGGAGGNSAAIAYMGTTAPQMSTSTLATGNLGAAGTGGAAGQGNGNTSAIGSPGAVGQAATVLKL